MVQAFTGYYQSVQILTRFLELAGVRVIKSRMSTPAIIEAGTTLASADLCFPLRVYVGHVHHLIQKHPDLEAIVAPNIISEDAKSSTCSKYRDVGGIALRSLGDTTGHRLHHLNKPGAKGLLQSLPLELEAVLDRVERSKHLPRFIMPDIRLLAEVDLRNVCYNVYADIMRWAPSRRLEFLLPSWLRKALGSPLNRLKRAFQQAVNEVTGRRGSQLEKLLTDPSRPRLALVGRRYVVEDPALNAGVKHWFEKQGVAVISAVDVPAALLEPEYDRVDGFYDAHKEAEAFIRWALDKVDGFIGLGCFGCHPDAFQVDYLADNIRSYGAPCWTLRFDETASNSGFQTRFETILTFLEQRRDQRVAGEKPARPALALPVFPDTGLRRVSGRPGQLVEEVQATGAPSGGAALKPLIIWPYMGEIVNLAVEGLCHQLGLQDYMLAPQPISEKTVLLGNDRYTESCSPYACSTGSLKETLTRALNSLEAAGAKAEPRRIIVLMARGEGPCTFGWYAIVQNRHIPQEFQQRLAAGGHTLQMVTMGMDGLVDALKEFSDLQRQKIKPLLDYVEACAYGLGRLPLWRQWHLRLRFLATLNRLTRPLWAKLDAAESLRARALILRAHELEPGSITAAYQTAIEGLRQVHTVAEIKAAHRRGLRLLEAVPRDSLVKPRVVVVGEIYVLLTSFANRGTVENLLAREGLEVHEGTTLGGYLRGVLREMKRRSWAANPWLRPVLAWLRQRNIYLLEQRVRDDRALPFLNREVGGDGLPSVAHAREGVEAGCDGIVHLYPFKCMPEGIAKGAVLELANLYNVRYLGLSFDKETEIERLRTEVSTFATLLHAQGMQEGAKDQRQYQSKRQQVIRWRKAVGRWVTGLYALSRRSRYVK
jgi:predicted nucleotide-binding protein (sugar kinase/HSP70/actin superfamily)